MTDEKNKGAFKESEEGGFEFPQEIHDLLAEVSK